MRVNVDDAALTDPRVRKLGRALGISHHEALGRLLPVWMLCYHRRSSELEIEDIDIASERDGFAVAMVQASLARPVPETDPPRAHVCGVTERIEFLLKQKERADKRWESERNAKAHASADAIASPSASPSASADGYAYSLTLTQATGSGSAAQTLAQVAVSEINRLAGSRYAAYSQTLIKDCKALAKRGVTEDAVRRVIAAKWAEWRGSDHMRPQFKPSVLLRPSNFTRYVEDLDARPSAPTSSLRLVPPTDSVRFDDGTTCEVPA